MLLTCLIFSGWGYRIHDLSPLLFWGGIAGWCFGCAASAVALIWWGIELEEQATCYGDT